MIVLDTNVASELMRASPAPAVADWVRAHGGSDLCTTSITLAEILYGIERLPAGRRRDLLKQTADEVFAAFEGQVLAFDAAAVSHYPAIVTRREHARLPSDGFDAQIASICQVHAATLATRNVADFEDTGIDLVDPGRADRAASGRATGRYCAANGRCGVRRAMSKTRCTAGGPGRITSS